MTRTLYVRIESDHDRSDLADRLAAIDAGEDVEPSESTLTVESLATFGRVFRPTNLAILEAIVEHEPKSIRQLASVLDRHPPDVLDNINELVDYGLVELEQDGRAKRPLVWYDEIDVDIPLRQPPSSRDIASV